MSAAQIDRLLRALREAQSRGNNLHLAVIDALNRIDVDSWGAEKILTEAADRFDKERANAPR